MPELLIRIINILNQYTMTSNKTRSQIPTPGILNKEEEQKLKTIIESIEKEPMSFEFLNPVDTVGLGLHDYFDIVLHPMDLASVKKKLLNNIIYIYVQEVLDDIQLIWTNCKVYNMEGSDIYKIAEYMEKQSRKIIEKYYKAPKAPSFNSKYFYVKFYFKFI